MKRTFVLLASTCLQITLAAGPAASPIQPHPESPHRFLFREKPTVLLSVGEHYASLINRDFDFRLYHESLAEAGLNQTRVFSGSFRGPLGQAEDLISPRWPENFVPPWAWTDEPGGYDGRKFDLDRWNPEYFARLEEVLRSASAHGVVVELVLFCTLYDERCWHLNPLNAANNMQCEGVLDSPAEFLTLRHPSIVARQKDLVRRLVAACREFDNVYFEVANEPYWSRKGEPAVTIEERAAWHAEIIRTIRAAESDLSPSQRHMIAINEWFEVPEKAEVGVINLHYVGEGGFTGAMTGLDKFSGLGKALVFDETEFERSNRVRRYCVGDARVEAWEFMLGGGSGYSNLALPHYTAQDERGSAPVPVELRRQIGALKRFLDGLDLVALRRDGSLLAEPPPAGAFARAMSVPGRFYVLYLHQSDPGGVDARRKPSYEVRTGDYQTDLVLDLPAGTYELAWIEPVDASVRSTVPLTHAGGRCVVPTPNYTDDIALTIRRVAAP
ncbi:MAG: hypothetical protein IAE82_16105 [Opitutaceae bacterium]|nr:hypothetical protein [Opitutaceae bacterium]